MGLAVSVVVSGIALGLLIGMLSFTLVFLNKTTGVANFAIGNIGMFEAFVVYRLYTAGLDIYIAVAVGLVLSVAFGGLVYQLVMRPFSRISGQGLFIVDTPGLWPAELVADWRASIR